MDRLMSVKDIQDRYQCSQSTARKYMRQMVHMEKPLTVNERELARWEVQRTVPPVKEIRRACK